MTTYLPITTVATHGKKFNERVSRVVSGEPMSPDGCIGEYLSQWCASSNHLQSKHLTLGLTGATSGRNRVYISPVMYSKRPYFGTTRSSWSSFLERTMQVTLNPHPTKSDSPTTTCQPSIWVFVAILSQTPPISHLPWPPVTLDHRLTWLGR